MTSTETEDMVEAMMMAGHGYTPSMLSSLKSMDPNLAEHYLSRMSRALSALRDRMPVLAWRPIDDGARSGEPILGRVTKGIPRGPRAGPSVMARWIEDSWKVGSTLYSADAIDAYIPIDPTTGLPVGMSGLPIVQPVPPTHRHYKGGLYRELHQATEEATMTPLVVYQAIADGHVWVRTVHDFESRVYVPDSLGNPVSVRRFEPIAQVEAQQVESDADRSALKAVEGSPQ